MPEVSTSDRRARTVIAATTATRAARSGALWGVLFGVMVANEALSYHKNFPTVASRVQFAESFGSNRGLLAVTGPARHLDTLEGFVAWRMLSLLIVVGSLWGLLTATRLLRGEEDAGRWELLLSGRTDRRHATVQALAGLATGFLALWASTALLTFAAGSRSTVGFSPSASLFYATAATASAGMFLAIGALTSQLASSRRQANGLAAAILGLSYVLRMVADGSASLGWVRWATPLGWVENLAALTAPQPLGLIPIALVVAAAAFSAVTIAGRRDAGVGAFARPGSRGSHTRLLGGPVGLTVRLERWVALSWVGGLAVLAFVFGLVARAAAEGDIGDKAVGQVVGQGSGAAAWIGYQFLYLAAILAFAAAGQISAIRSEEADGHLDNLLARPLSRRTWLVSRLGFSAVLVAVSGLAAGAGGWLGVAGRGDIGPGDMLEAGFNVAVPGLFILGAGTLLYGLAPRLAVPVLHGLVLWSFLVEIIGTSITQSRWLLDTSVLSHLGPVPATELNWAATGWLIGLALIAVLAGLAAFNRRDLVGA